MLNPHDVPEEVRLRNVRQLTFDGENAAAARAAIEEEAEAEVRHILEDQWLADRHDIVAEVAEDDQEVVRIGGHRTVHRDRLHPVDQHVGDIDLVVGGPTDTDGLLKVLPGLQGVVLRLDLGTCRAQCARPKQNCPTEKYSRL